MARIEMIEADPDRPEAPAPLNLSNQAHRAVTEMIRRRNLRGGEVIVEARLADHLSISRTPLREALQRLEGEGLVVKGTCRSYVVRNVDLVEYMQSLKVREILEPEAAALAVGRVPGPEIASIRREIEALREATAYHTDDHWRSDDRVHRVYAGHCGNDVLERMIDELRVTTRMFEIARLADRLEPDSIEHLQILEAIEQADPKGARKAVQSHLRSLARFALDTVR